MRFFGKLSFKKMDLSEQNVTCERNMMIQTQAWSRLNQEPFSEPAGHSKNVCSGNAGVLLNSWVGKVEIFLDIDVVQTTII